MGTFTNASGSNYNDTIKDSYIGNIIEGNGGNDVIWGYGGGDTIKGAQVLTLFVFTEDVHDFEIFKESSGSDHFTFLKTMNYLLQLRALRHSGFLMAITTMKSPHQCFRTVYSGQPGGNHCKSGRCTIEDDQLSVNVQVHDADGNGGWTVQWQMESNGGWTNLLNETSHILHLDQMHVGKLVRAEITHTDDKGNVTR